MIDGRKKIYISGPMTGMEDYNFPAFNKAEEYLRNEFPSAEIVNPARLGDVIAKEEEGKSFNELRWEAYMRRDIRELVDCTDIVLLRDWENSRGSKLENHIASELGFGQWDLDLETMELCGLTGGTM